MSAEKFPSKIRGSYERPPSGGLFVFRAVSARRRHAARPARARRRPPSDPVAVLRLARPWPDRGRRDDREPAAATVLPRPKAPALDRRTGRGSNGSGRPATARPRPRAPPPCTLARRRINLKEPARLPQSQKGLSEKIMTARNDDSYPKWGLRGFSISFGNRNRRAQVLFGWRAVDDRMLRVSGG